MYIISIFLHVPDFPLSVYLNSLLRFILLIMQMVRNLSNKALR